MTTYLLCENAIKQLISELAFFHKMTEFRAIIPPAVTDTHFKKIYPLVLGKVIVSVN